MGRHRKRGAKPLPDGQAKSRVLLVRLRPTDYEALVAAAAGGPVSAWARVVLLAAVGANRSTEPTA
jgi:hypothetical protein